MSILFNWTVVGILVPTLIGIGVGVLSLTPAEFLVAKACFILAGIILLVKVGIWALYTDDAISQRIIVSFMVAGLTCTLLVEAVRWIEKRQGLISSSLPATDTVAPAQPPAISTAPAPIQKPSEPAPSIHEKVELAPTPIPRKATPPVTKKDVPIKPKEIIPEKSDKPIETAQTTPIEATPIQPKEKIAAVLIKKCSELPPTIVAAPDRFIPLWIKRINIVREDREKRHLRPDLDRLIREIGRPPSSGLTVKEFVDDAVAEATFTLRCLESEGYIQITVTATQGRWYAIDFPNLEFEFVPERLNEFIEGL